MEAHHHHQENLDNLRVASFSYYLKPGEESFVHKINGIHHHINDDPLPPATLSHELSSTTKPPIIKPSQNLNFSKSIESQDNIPFRVKSPQVHDLDAAVYSSAHQAERISSSSNNGEIGVFGADKYFNMPLEDNTTSETERENNRGPVDIAGLNLILRPKTPSISSEASSWNSQAALLRNLSQKGSSQTRQRRTNRRRIFASFGCGGQCLEKGAVSIAETPRKDARRLNHFAFPVLNNDSESNSQVVTIKKPPIFLKDEHDKGLIERKSLDVFGSGRMKNGDIAIKLARNLSMLTWDAIPKSTNASTTTLGSTTIYHDQDMTSDASSDLFEIEDISGAGYGIMSNMEDANQEINHGNVASVGNFTPSSPPTHEYVPSEASIEWSVVTASAAADYSSVISDYDEKYVGISGEGMIHTNNSGHRNFNAKNLEGKEAQKGRPGGLLGCKSHKAVNVVETAVPKSRFVERY